MKLGPKEGQKLCQTYINCVQTYMPLRCESGKCRRQILEFTKIWKVDMN